MDGMLSTAKKSILFHILAGALFWGEVLTGYSWVGGSLIVLGSVLLLRQ